MPTPTAAPSKPTIPTAPSPGPTIVEPNAPIAPNAPGEVGSWETSFGEHFEAPAAPAAKVATPPEAPAKPATPATPPAKPAEPAKPAATPAKPATPPDHGGRKSKLDPDELLSVEGVDDAALPESVVEALKTLDARDLRLQSAKLAQRLRSVGVELKKKDAELGEARKPKEDPEKKSLLDERTALQKRLETAEVELRHTNYLKSEEYRSKFEAPFKETLAEAYSAITEFSVEQEDGTFRTATQKDFDHLLNLPRGEAIKVAKQQFGDAAEEILSYTRKLSEIRKGASRAADEHRAKGEELGKKQQSDLAAQREQHNQVWAKANETIATKYKHIFGKEEGDDEGNALIEQGYKDVDAAHDPNLPVEDRIRRQAAIRHSAAALSKWVKKAKSWEARYNEVKTKLEEYEASAPTTGASDGTPAPAEDPEADPMAAIDRMATPAGR